MKLARQNLLDLNETTVIPDASNALGAWDMDRIRGLKFESPVSDLDPRTTIPDDYVEMTMKLHPRNKCLHVLGPIERLQSVLTSRGPCCFVVPLHRSGMFLAPKARFISSQGHRPRVSIVNGRSAEGAIQSEDCQLTSIKGTRLQREEGFSGGSWGVAPG
jgi:hypothetical protein